MSSFTVISFFTPDWQYPEHAKNLVADCQRLNLDYIIEQKNSTGSYVGNCNLKPNFIKEKLQSLKQPVLWIDVDGSILRIPQELSLDVDADIVAYQNHTFPDRIYVCTLFFNYTPATLDFVDTWCQDSRNFIDDGAFNSALQNKDLKISLQTLPSDQIVVLKNSQQTPNQKVCFVHRLSSSDLKWQYKNKVEKRT